MDGFDPWDSLAHLRIVTLLEERIGRGLTTEEILSVVDVATIQAIADAPART